MGRLHALAGHRFGDDIQPEFGWSSPGPAPGNGDAPVDQHTPVAAPTPAPRPPMNRLQRILARQFRGNDQATSLFWGGASAPRARAHSVIAAGRRGALDFDPAAGTVTFGAVGTTGAPAGSYPETGTASFDLSRRPQARAYNRLQRIDARGSR